MAGMTCRFNWSGIEEGRNEMKEKLDSNPFMSSHAVYADAHIVVFADRLLPLLGPSGNFNFISIFLNIIQAGGESRVLRAAGDSAEVVHGSSGE
jgi:hypothetical protein